MSIQLQNVTKRYSSHVLFEDLNLQIVAKTRVGLIGRNGAGKSTLLKMMMSQVEPDGGVVAITPGIQVNYLSQEPRITPHLTLIEEMRTVFAELDSLMAQEKKYLAMLEEPMSDDEQMAVIEKLTTAQQALYRLDPDTVDARIGRILQGLGFTQEEYDRKTGEFSGGWQMRINLAKVLLEGAEILLLDEPTNHLDLEACEWMENFLKDYPGGIVVVSHDRHFLDSVVTEIAELELGKMRLWAGNYTKYLEQKEAEKELLTSAHDRQKKELDKQTEFVQRFKASATRGTQAKSREKQLAKIERIEIPQEDTRRMTVRFPPPEPSGIEVIRLEHVAKSFGENKLFSNLTAQMARQQRIFILGENGTGKTTLLRLIQGLEKPDAGEIKLGHNVLLGYFSQNQLETLDPNLNVFDTLHNVAPKMNNTEIRSYLGRFLFSGDQVFKKVGVLSGGEKSKVALARLMLAGPNTLLLDEPTNHMDIPAKDVITEALKEYEGSILCISHDRQLIQELATEIWEVYNGQLLIYTGAYDYYLRKREEMHASAKKPSKPKPVEIKSEPRQTSSPETHQKKEAEKNLKRLEKQIVRLEGDISALQAELEDPALQTDYAKLQALADQISDKQGELNTANLEWTALAEDLA